MNNYIQRIADDISNCEFEISQLKKIIAGLYNKPLDRQVIIRYATPALYSIWEGFFVRSLTEYINFINSLALSRDQIQDIIVAHNLEITLNLSVSRTNFDTIKAFSNDLQQHFSNTFFINSKIITESNVNYKVANAMFTRLCLNTLDQKRNAELNKLLKYRNNIAHGECSIPVTDEVINELSIIVINCIYDTFLLINDGITNLTFRKI